MFDRKALSLIIVGAGISSSLAFTTPTPAKASSSTTSLNGLFDKWETGGSGNSKESLDDEWKKQQEILKFRRSSNENKAKYFENVSHMLLTHIYKCWLVLG